jgi:hypothetical protein
MSAFGGKADLFHGLAKNPLIAKSGHKDGRDHFLDAAKVDDARTKLLVLKHLGRMFALREEQAEVARSNRFGCADFSRS